MDGNRFAVDFIHDLKLEKLPSSVVTSFRRGIGGKICDDYPRNLNGGGEDFRHQHREAF